jgi:hypothetical protein
VIILINRCKGTEKIEKRKKNKRKSDIKRENYDINNENGLFTTEK